MPPQPDYHNQQTSPELSRWKSWLILLSAAVVIAYIYCCLRADSANLTNRMELHQEIISGNAGSPYRYRVLVPFLCEVAIRTFPHFVSYERAFILTYFMYDLAAILLAFCTLRMLLRTWFSEIQALLGLLFVACTMPIALRDHYYQPWTLLEIGFFTIGLLLIMENRRYSLLFLILIASLNRETTVFIVLAFLLANLPLERPLRGDMVHAIKRVLPYLALYMVAWLGVFCGLRIMLGPATHVIDIPKLFRVNIQIGHLALTAWQAFWFLGAFWAFAFLGYAKAPLVIQRLVWVVPFYLTTFMVFGYWWEVRLLMPMYAIFLPLALSFLFPPQDSLRGIGVAHAGK